MFTYIGSVMFVAVLKSILFSDDPEPTVLIPLATYIMKNVDRDWLPDMVEAISNANPNNWEASLDEIRKGTREEENSDYKYLYNNKTK